MLYTGITVTIIRGPRRRPWGRRGRPSRTPGTRPAQRPRPEPVAAILVVLVLSVCCMCCVFVLLSICIDKIVLQVAAIRYTPCGGGEAAVK